MTPVRDLLRISPVIPVVSIERAGDAPALAEALLAGGIGIVEVTLRSGAALDAMAAIRRDRPEMVVGAGTIRTTEQMRAAAAAGAQFAVSPGFVAELGPAARECRLPYLPGAATASEVMRLAAEGLDALKFFPAEAAGGVAVLKQFQPVFPEVVFCPTGGLTPANAGGYLALDNVACVGGSWIADKSLLERRDFAAIESRAREATRLREAAPS